MKHESGVLDPSGSAGPKRDGALREKRVGNQVRFLWWNCCPGTGREVCAEAKFMY